jgi:hypothetical protein
MDYTINVLVIVNLILCLYFIYISCNLLIEKFDVKSPTDMSHNHYSDVSDVANNEGCGGDSCGLCVEYNNHCNFDNDNCCAGFSCMESVVQIPSFKFVSGKIVSYNRSVNITRCE